MPLPRFALLLLGALTALVSSAQAHFVWLERDAASGSVAAFFGEWSDNVRETQEGYLKILRSPTATGPAGKPIAVEVRTDRLALTTSAPAGDHRLACVYFPEKGTTLMRYGAKLGRASTTTVLPLELVPVTPDGNAFTLLLHGKPVADTGVTLFTAAGWQRTFKTGADGRVVIETPWPGPAVLEVAHVEKTTGEHEGRAYEAIRHVSTVMISVPAK